MRTGTLSLHDTTVSVWEDDVNEDELKVEVYGPLVRFLRDRGYNIRRDPHTAKHYRSISDRHHRGRKGDLEVILNLGGRHLEILFFQNIRTENRNGGQYDFEKFEKMPYLMQKRFVLEASLILEYLHALHGYPLDNKLQEASPKSIIAHLRGINRAKEPLRGFNNAWGADRFKRDESGWPVAAEYDYGCNKDREGVYLRNGMFRWFRDHNGYLWCGTIYTNMNNMWQVVHGPGRQDTTWVSCGELFTLQADDHRRRFFSDKQRKHYLEKVFSRAVKEMRFERAAVLRDLVYGSRENALAEAA